METQLSDLKYVFTTYPTSENWYEQCNNRVDFWLLEVIFAAVVAFWLFLNFDTSLGLQGDTRNAKVIRFVFLYIAGMLHPIRVCSRIGAHEWGKQSTSKRMMREFPWHFITGAVLYCVYLSLRAMFSRWFPGRPDAHKSDLEKHDWNTVLEKYKYDEPPEREGDSLLKRSLQGT